MEYSMAVQGNLKFIGMAIWKIYGIQWNSIIFDLVAQEFHVILWNILCSYTTGREYRRK